MGETWVGRPHADIVSVSGKDRVDLLHRLSTNDLEPLANVGFVRSTLFTTAQGRLIDWVTVLATEDALLLVCSVGRGVRVAEWIETYTIMEDVKTVVSTAWTLLVVEGKRAQSIVGEAGARGVASRHDFGWVWRGVEGYANRFEVLVPSAEADACARGFVVAGATVADDAHLEISRVLAGVPGPAGEYPDDVNPLELRLGPVAVSFRKGCYIGQEVISRLDSYDKVQRLLVGFNVDPTLAARLPRDGQELKLTREGRPFGRVTSLVALPDGGAAGLAVVKREGADAAAAELALGDGAIPVKLERRGFPG